MWHFDSFFFEVGAFWMFSCVFLPAVSTLSPGCVLQMWPAEGSSSITLLLSIDLSSGATWRFLPPVLSQLVFVQKTAPRGRGAFPAITKQAQQTSSCTLTALPPSPPAWRQTSSQCYFPLTVHFVGLTEAFLSRSTASAHSAGSALHCKHSSVFTKLNFYWNFKYLNNYRSENKTETNKNTNTVNLQDDPISPNTTSVLSRASDTSCRTLLDSEADHDGPIIKKQRPLTVERSEGETRQLILRIRNNLTYLFYELQQNFLCLGCDQLRAVNFSMTFVTRMNR